MNPNVWWRIVATSTSGASCSMQGRVARCWWVYNRPTMKPVPQPTAVLVKQAKHGCGACRIATKFHSSCRAKKSTTRPLGTLQSGGKPGTLMCEREAVIEVRWERPDVRTRQTALGRTRGAWSSRCSCLGRPQEGQNQARRGALLGEGRGLSQRRRPGAEGCPIL